MFAGADDNVIVCEELWATKAYHTSYLSEAPHPIVVPGKVVGFQVAFTLVPAVFTQLVEEVNVIAAEHSSLAGCANELNDSVRPNNRKMAVVKGYRNDFMIACSLWFSEYRIADKINLNYV